MTASQGADSPSDSRQGESFLNSRHYTRRDVLKAGAGFAALAALGPALSACGSTAVNTGTSASPSSSGPKKGGELTVGLLGAAPQDNLDAMIGTTVGSECNARQLYDQLVRATPDQKELRLWLAESLEPNSDGSAWTVRLKPDLVFHNGKSVTADDVIFSFERQVDKELPVSGLLSNAGLKSMKKLDGLTTRFELEGPCSWFPDVLKEWRCNIVPVGYNPDSISGAIGTGPWKVASWDPGTETVFVPNTDYWGEGPYAEKLSIVGFEDPVAVVNALQSGAVDWACPLSGTQAPILDQTPGMASVKADTGAYTMFVMNCNTKPYSDSRVRKAFKLIAGRQEMIDQAVGGLARLGNDMPAPYDPGYPHDVPQREQDLEQARSLLKQAGYDNSLTVQLRTSEEVGAGAVEATQVFAQQAKGAGVNAEVVKLPVGVIWGENYLKWPWAQDLSNTRGYLASVSYYSLPTSPYNDTHWADSKWLAIVTEAAATVDDAKRNELIGEAMRMQGEDDGQLIWSFRQLVDGSSDKVAGYIPYNYGQSAIYFDFYNVYFV